MDTATTAHGRRPDFIEIGGVIGDVKNVGDPDDTEQMCDNLRIAQALDVRVAGGIPTASGLPNAGTTRMLDPTTDTTPHIDLIVRVPWHPRGPTNVTPALDTLIRTDGHGEILELIDDPRLDPPP